MILFKACPRCGGDVDAGYPDDVRCVQCAYRPALALAESRAADGREAASGMHSQTFSAQVNDMNGMVNCPRCGSEEVVKLEKVRRQDHTCFRCRMCGHIFSPQAESEREESAAALP